MLTLETNLADAVRALDDVAKRQIPFALSRAMNAAAFDVRKEIVERTWPASVTMRNKRFAAAAMRVTRKATKSDLTVEVLDKLGRDAFSRQADSELRRPVSGRNLAIPKINRLAGGSIRKDMRPRAVLNKKGYFKNRKGTAILQRMRNGKLRLVYVLTPQANVRKRFNAYDAAERAFVRSMVAGFNKHLTAAIERPFDRLTMRPVR